jgi:ribonuclease PH
MSDGIQMMTSEAFCFMQVLQSDGGERAACINAAMLAIANAGD